ncbi:hypothetical protein LTR56_003975 [Elasticomyces elasticus]|nr:hypothetical protein LTR56_003975 [Elasticomyces elasticus]KAK3661035.1 hypothetical protein LTR22_007661 [Elasticomyces elasticus]KAK4921043.1 hypothetical protein LTR49_011413 [Elasticomyces elasticus]KAK5752993.1 hypothetical protein LTS12_016964 [Elasticomyces elasticus]
MSSAAALVVPAIKRHTSTVIVAHGLGDRMFLAEQWRSRNKFEETKFVFPNAPQIPITVNMGMRMPGWYDIADFGDLANRSEDEAGVLRSQKVFHTLIQDEIKAGIPTERIVLGGFSQGGAMSLMAGITNPTKLGGIFGLSCYLLLKDKVQSMVPSDSPNKATPIFMGHGDADQVVRYAWGKMTADTLKGWGWNVDFKTYRGLPHSAAPEEIDDLEKYLNQRIPPLGDKAGGS